MVLLTFQILSVQGYGCTVLLHLRLIIVDACEDGEENEDGADILLKTLNLFTCIFYFYELVSFQKNIILLQGNKNKSGGTA